MDANFRPEKRLASEIFSIREYNSTKLCSRTLRLWIVDDSKLILRWLDCLFKQKATFCTPVFYDSANKLLIDLLDSSIPQTAKPDVIITDLEMPGMDGYTLCRQIRTKYRPAELPIIMLTSVDPLKAKTKGYGVGANHYISKSTGKNGQGVLLDILETYSRAFEARGKV